MFNSPIVSVCDTLNRNNFALKNVFKAFGMSDAESTCNVLNELYLVSVYFVFFVLLLYVRSYAY